ncbi:MAG: glycosyltransferase [Bacteroidota bacterium]
MPTSKALTTFSFEQHTLNNQAIKLLHKYSSILILSPAHPLRGGIATFGERLALELQNRGHQVVIHSFALQYPNFLFPGKTQFSNDPPPKDLDIQTTINSVYPLNWWRVGNQLKKTHFDLVICAFWLPFMGPSLGTILRRIKSNKHSKIVGLIHNIVPHEKHLGDRVLAKYFTTTVDAFVSLSKAVIAQLRTFEPNKPMVFIPHPIYDNYGAIIDKAVAKKQLGLSSKQSYLLFFGFIRAYKGLDLLLEAMSDERVKALGVKLIVAGEFYGEAATYHQQIANLGIANQLELHTHFISNEAVKYYFSATDLVVQPYKTATQSGISQIAYHFERPMIVTDVGGLAEIVPDGRAGYVVEVKAKAIADAIFDFYKNDRFESLKKGVQESKSAFSWTNLADSILSL